MRLSGSVCCGFASCTSFSTFKLFFAATFLTGSDSIGIDVMDGCGFVGAGAATTGAVWAATAFGARGLVAGLAKVAVFADFMDSCANNFPGDAFPTSESSLAGCASLILALASPSTFLFAALIAPACISVDSAGVDLVR